MITDSRGLEIKLGGTLGYISRDRKLTTGKVVELRTRQYQSYDGTLRTKNTVYVWVENKYGGRRIVLTKPQKSLALA